MKECTGLNAHSLSDSNMKTIMRDKYRIVRECTMCGLKKELPHSSQRILFPNNLVMQKKKWSADDNRKELLQPLHLSGEINEEFTEAYGYNPLDDRTKAFTPKVQGGDLE